MTLKELIEDLQRIYMLNPAVNSTGYGEREAYNADKYGVDYPRAYLHLERATRTHVTVELIVTDEVLSDLSNSLDVQSRMLTLSKELVMQMIRANYLKYDEKETFNTTGLYAEDQSMGYKSSIEIILDEEIDVCLIPEV